MRLPILIKLEEMTMRRLVEVAVFAFAFALGWFAAGGTVELAWLYVSYAVVRLEYQHVMFGPSPLEVVLWFLVVPCIIAVLIVRRRKRVHAVAFIVIGLALLATPVLAQDRPKPPRAAPAETFPAATRNVTGTNIPCDPANLLPGCRHADGTINTSGSTDDLLTKLLKVQKIDLIYAKALADAAGTDGAKMRSKCWGAWITLIDQQSGTDAKDAQGNPLGPKPDPDLFTKLEQIGQTADALSPASPFMVACTPVSQAIKMTVAQFVAAAVGGGLSLAKFVPGL